MSVSAVLKRCVTAVILASLSPVPLAAKTLPPIPVVKPGPYRLGAGDGVQIMIYGMDAATRSYVIGDGGTVSIPLVGQLIATGKTVAELEALIVSTLKSKELMKAPSVSVQVEKYRPFFILGEVQKPGQYAYVPGMSVLTAISIAGGFTFRAQKHRATIVRNLDGNMVSGTARPETAIQPGDTVNIPEAWF